VSGSRLRVRMVLNARIHREDGSYWADVAELPGVFASGVTFTELREALGEAVALTLDVPEDAVTIPVVERLEAGDRRIAVAA